MDSHLLFELTYVFYRVCSAIIHGERWLVELSRKFCLFYPPCKRWLRNLAQRLFHNVSSYSFARRAPAFPSVKMLFLTGEGFAWWGSWPPSVYSVLFTIGRDIRAGRGSLLLCSIELLLQVINHFVHGICDISFENRFYLCGWYVHCLLDSSPDLFYVQGRGNHLVDEHLWTPFDADLLDVDLILPYRPLYFPNTQVLPTDGANCRVTICSPSPKGMRSWPSELNTINL